MNQVPKDFSDSPIDPVYFPQSVIVKPSTINKKWLIRGIPINNDPYQPTDILSINGAPPFHLSIPWNFLAWCRSCCVICAPQSSPNSAKAEPWSAQGLEHRGVLNKPWNIRNIRNTQKKWWFDMILKWFLGIYTVFLATRNLNMSFWNEYF